MYYVIAIAFVAFIIFVLLCALAMGGVSGDKHRHEYKHSKECGKCDKHKHKHSKECDRYRKCDKHHKCRRKHRKREGEAIGSILGIERLNRPNRDPRPPQSEPLESGEVRFATREELGRVTMFGFNLLELADANYDWIAEKSGINPEVGTQLYLYMLNAAFNRGLAIYYADLFDIDDIWDFPKFQFYVLIYRGHYHISGYAIALDNGYISDCSEIEGHTITYGKYDQRSIYLTTGPIISIRTRPIMSGSSVPGLYVDGLRHVINDVPLDDKVIEELERLGRDGIGFRFILLTQLYHAIGYVFIPATIIEDEYDFELNSDMYVFIKVEQGGESELLETYETNLDPDIIGIGANEWEARTDSVIETQYGELIPPTRTGINSFMYY